MPAEPAAVVAVFNIQSRAGGFPVLIRLRLFARFVLGRRHSRAEPFRPRLWLRLRLWQWLWLGYGYGFG
jgi:hypothetical protein